MLDPKLPQDQSELTVTPAQLEVVLTDDDSSPLALVLAPLDDLQEMEAFSEKNFSIKNLVEKELSRSSVHFRNELNRLLNNSSGSESSTTFQNRLANLASASGDIELEHKFLENAANRSKNIFFSHRLSSNLIERGLLDAAEALLQNPSLAPDAQTCLRLAFFHTRRKDFDRASSCVSKAIELDPLDYGVRLFDGALRLVEGRYEKAITSFRIAEEAKPNSSVLYCNMGIAYIRMAKFDKAMASLKKAVALNPLNAIAVVLFSDVASKNKKDHEAIPTLRLYLQFEQKDAGVWARLSRSLLANGQIEESIAALKRQGSLSPDDPTVWNNLGVAYHRRGDKKRAAESYKKAIELDEVEKSRTFFLAAKNFAVLLQESADPRDLLSFTDLFISGRSIYQSLTEREYAELIMLRIHALFRSAQAEDAIASCESILQSSDASHLLRMWVLIALLSWYPLNDEYERALDLAYKYSDQVNEFAKENKDLRTQLINNLAFTFAEGGLLDDATAFIAMISHRIHRDCYPTATLGLIHIRKGDHEGGKMLYEEAVRLALPHEDKVRIKQKYRLELAKIDISNGDIKKALRNLSRVSTTNDGELGLIKLSKRLILSLR